MRYLIILFLLCGCSSSDTSKRLEAVESFVKGCKGEIKATLKVGSWDNYFIMECEKMDKTLDD